MTGSHPSICPPGRSGQQSKQSWTFGGPGWPPLPNGSAVFKYGQRPGDLSGGPAARLIVPAFAPAAAAVRCSAAHLFVCSAALVWTADFLCKPGEIGSFQRRSRLPRRLKATRSGFVFPFSGMAKPAATSKFIYYLCNNTELETLYC